MSMFTLRFAARVWTPFFAYTQVTMRRLQIFANQQPDGILFVFPAIFLYFLQARYAHLPVAADSFFSIRDARGRTHYFLEADRGTMPLKRFTRKLIAYAAYDKAEKHQDKFGIRK